MYRIHIEKKEKNYSRNYKAQKNKSNNKHFSNKFFQILIQFLK